MCQHTNLTRKQANNGCFHTQSKTQNTHGAQLQHGEQEPHLEQRGHERLHRAVFPDDYQRPGHKALVNDDQHFKPVVFRLILWCRYMNNHMGAQEQKYFKVRLSNVRVFLEAESAQEYARTRERC